VPDRDVAHLARTHGAGAVTLTCRGPSLGVDVPDPGKGLTPMERTMRATSSLLIGSPGEGVEVVRVNAGTRVRRAGRPDHARRRARGESKTSIEPCKSLGRRHVVGRRVRLQHV